MVTVKLLKAINEDEFDKLIPVSRYAAVKLLENNKLFILDPADSANSAFMIEGYIAETYASIDGLKNLGQFVEETMKRQRVPKAVARNYVQKAFDELLKYNLIEISEGKDEEKNIKKKRTQKEA